MKDAYDLHVHVSPSIFRRWGDGEQTAELCQAAGMGGIVLKAHHGSTTELATHLDRKFTINVFGGVVLNYFVGGLNPYAVDACCALGGKVVWLPTVHAAAHKPLGKFEFQEPKTEKMPSRGIRIAKGSRLVRAMYEILEILHNKGVVLATGHVSAEEIKTLAKAVRKEQYQVQILVNHVHFFSPALDKPDIQSLRAENIWFEVSQFTQKIGASGIDRVARCIEELPEANWIMVSDSGQPGNTPPQALQVFREQLLQQGITQEMLDRMMIVAPRELLG